MASVTFWEVKSRTKELRPLVCRFVGGGAAADMTIASGLKVHGFASCKYNAATGLYRITLNDKYSDFRGGHFTVMAAGNLVCKPTAYSVANKTIDVKIITTTAGTATDLATTEELWVTLFYANTQVG